MIVFQVLATQSVTWELVGHAETQVPPQTSQPESSFSQGSWVIPSEIKQHRFRKPLKSLGVICFIVFRGSLQVLWRKWLRRECFYCYFIIAFEVVCLVHYFSFQDSPAVIWPFST